MDARMQSTSTAAGQYPTWDYFVSGGIVPIISGTDEDAQAATMAAFLQVGTIPQLPEEGVDWVGYTMGEASFNEIDNKIKANLSSIGLTDYCPTYDLVNDTLVTNVGKQ